MAESKGNSILPRSARKAAEWVTVPHVAIGLLIVGLPFLLGRYTAKSLDTATSVGASQIELQSLILKVKSDLYGAEQVAIARGEMPLLHLTDVELEVAFVAQAKSSGEVQLLAVTSSSEVELGRTQRVKLRLSPIPAKQVSVKPENSPIVDESVTPTVIGSVPVAGARSLPQQEAGKKGSR